MSRLKARLRNDQGFSLIEMTVTSGIVLLIAAMVMSVFVVSNRYVNLTGRRAVAADEARRIIDESARSLRNARPLGVCLESNADGCVRVGERPFSLIVASPEQVCWWENRQQNVATDVLRPAWQTCLRVETPTENEGGTQLLVREAWAPGLGVTYISDRDPAAERAGNPTVREVIAPVQPMPETTGFFSYLTSTNTTTTDLSRIATVRFQAQVSLNDVDAERLGRADTLSFTAALRGSRYEREQIRW